MEKEANKHDSPGLKTKALLLTIRRALIMVTKAIEVYLGNPTE